MDKRSAAEKKEKNKMYHRAYYLKHREKLIAKAKEYGKTEERKKKMREYAHAHKAHLREKNKQYRAAHHEKYCEYMAKYYAANKEQLSEKKKAAYALLKTKEAA